MNHPTLSFRQESRTIREIERLYEEEILNLEPGFQRKSVWSLRDRTKLIDSIMRNYPLPAIFLYRREENGQYIYDVIDGKQRIESVLMFMGSKRGKFGFKSQLPGSEKIEYIDWKVLGRQKSQHLMTGYRIPVIEVDGHLGDIIDLFVRINSTGKALTPQEKRSAKYYNSPFLKVADKVARRYVKYFSEMGVFSAGQFSRMKHVEFVCELMLSINQLEPINKKLALDRIMKTEGFTVRDITKSAKKTILVLNRVRKMFPKLKTTRLRQITDFYSLALLIAKYEEEGLILTNKRLNGLAWDLLVAFAIQVDDVREKQRKAKGIKADQETARDYLLTVSQMTDDVNQRRKRQAILHNIIGSLFAKKDAQRGYTSEQRRILWNSTASPKCQSCDVILNWDDFTIDHIAPHSKGGRSRLENSALMCRSCNSSKGNRA